MIDLKSSIDIDSTKANNEIHYYMIYIADLLDKVKYNICIVTLVSFYS